MTVNMYIYIYTYIYIILFTTKHASQNLGSQPPHVLKTSSFQAALRFVSQKSNPLTYHRGKKNLLQTASFLLGSDGGKMFPPKSEVKTFLKNPLDPPPYPVVIFASTKIFKKPTKNKVSKTVGKRRKKSTPLFVSCIKASSSSAKSLCSISGKPLTRSCATRRVVGRSSANFRNKGLEMMLSPG